MASRDRATLSRAIITPAGPIAIRAVFTGCKVQCARCAQWFPLSEVGMRIYQEGTEWQVRNQPRCSQCRHLKLVPSAEPEEE